MIDKNKKQFRTSILESPSMKTSVDKLKTGEQESRNANHLDQSSIDISEI